MKDKIIFKIMAGRGCITYDKQTICRDGMRTEEKRDIEKCHSHYSDVVEEALKEQKELVYKKLSEIYDSDDNYGKKVTIDIDHSISVE